MKGKNMVQTGTIAVSPTTTPQLGEPLLFDYTVEGLHGQQTPRIQIEAFQDGGIVYTDARNAEPNNDGISQPFDPLGGTSSTWLANGGPAHIVAKLYYWGNVHGQQTFHQLGDTLEFDAAG